MIATNVRRLSVYLVLAFASVSGALVWWQLGTALRSSLGESVAENARATANLWSQFSEVAASNPVASVVSTKRSSAGGGPGSARG